MKTRIILLSLLLCLCQMAQAQISDSTAKYRHYIGVIVSPVLNELFTNNRELPVGIICRRQTKPDAAFRVAIIGAHDSFKFTSRIGSPDDYRKTHQTYVQFTFGYEWQQDLGRRWRLYYGTEAGPFVSRKVQDELNYRQTEAGDANYTIYAVDETRGLVLRPFAGVTFKISERLYLATETAVLARYQQRESDAKEKMVTISSNEILLDVRSNGIWRDNSIKYQPLSNVSLLLRF